MDKHSQPKFIADVMVGRLARWLRILGFDVLYSNRYEDDDIIRLAELSDRIILTRDVPLVSRVAPDRAIRIEEGGYGRQVAQVLKRLGPVEFRTLSRCPECNDLLRQADRQTVEGRVPPYVYQTHQEFAVCPACSRVYWHGTHVEGIEEQVRRWTNEGNETGKFKH